MRICNHEGCGRKHFAKGYCQLHYYRHRKGLDMDVPAKVYSGIRNKPNFMDNLTEPDSNGCQFWTGVINAHGYGRFKEYGKDWYSHRYYKEVILGEPIEEGKILMHTCRSNGASCNHKKCVVHTKVATHKENLNDYDTIGENHGSASVPDRWIPIIVRFYNKHPSCTQMDIADYLTNLGFPTVQPTISCWINGKSRSYSLI